MGSIERFGKSLRETFEKGRRNQKLARVGGNFSIVIHEHTAWTVLTSGPRAGVHETMTDDAMDFIMVTTLEIFEQMFPEGGGDVDLDLDSINAKKQVAMHGDLDVFLRFMTMSGAEGMLSLRAGGGASSAPKTTKKRRAV
jgi:hypothetical protein